MKKSSSMSALFLGSVVVVSFAMGAVQAMAQSALQYDIVVDQYGSLIGQIGGSGITVDTATNTASVPVVTRTAAPTGVTMSTLAPAFTPTPTTVTVKVPASIPVGFCVSGDYYDKHTGLCADGKPPYKIVPTGSLSNSAAQTPTVACSAPKVPTFSSSTSTWSCLVPPGYKSTM